MHESQDNVVNATRCPLSNGRMLHHHLPEPGGLCWHPVLEDLSRSITLVITVRRPKPCLVAYDDNSTIPQCVWWAQWSSGSKAAMSGFATLDQLAKAVDRRAARAIRVRALLVSKGSRCFDAPLQSWMVAQQVRSPLPYAITTHSATPPHPHHGHFPPHPIPPNPIPSLSLESRRTALKGPM